MTKQRRVPLGALGLCAALVACGGGGAESASPTPSNTAPTAQPAALSPQLGRDALRKVAAGIHEDLLRSQNIALAAIDAYQGVPSYLTLGSRTWLCAGAGSLDVSVTDVNARAALDGGDVVSMDFDQCRTDASTQAPALDGRQAFAVSSASGAPVALGTWSARMSITWTHLLSASANAMLGSDLHGVMNFDIAQSGSAIDVTTSTPSLTRSDVLTTALAGLPSGHALASLEYVGFNTAVSVGADRKTSIQGQTVYRDLGRPGVSPVTATYATPAPFTASLGGTPISGSVQVQASAWRGVTVNGQVVPGVTLPGRTTFRWTVLDAASVRLDTDENSDGVNESSFVFTFAELAQ